MESVHGHDSIRLNFWCSKLEEFVDKAYSARIDLSEIEEMYYYALRTLMTTNDTDRAVKDSFDNSIRLQDDYDCCTHEGVCSLLDRLEGVVYEMSFRLSPYIGNFIIEKVEVHPYGLCFRITLQRKTLSYIFG